MLKTGRARLLNLLLAVLVLFATQSLAAWREVGRVTAVSPVSTGGITLSTSSGAKVTITFTAANVIRIRIAPSGKFEPDKSYALDPDRGRAEGPTVTVSQTASVVTLVSGGTRVTIQKAEFGVTVTDANGKVLVQNDQSLRTSFDPATGEIQTTMLRRSEIETYYGFGEKAFSEMSRDGKFIVNWNTDTFSYPIGTDPVYQSIPFFTALYHGSSYGLFFNNTYRTWFDMGAKSPERYSFGAAGGELDYYVFTGGPDQTPRQVLADYAKLTGKTPLPPIWALGNQQSRWSYFPESRVREIAKGFRKNKIPADVIYLDIDYMDGYRVFTWDKTRFPDPAKMISDLKADGFKTVLIIDPGIKADLKYAAYADGKTQGIFVKNPDGSELNRDVWPQSSAFPDFTDPKARAWFGAQYKTHIDEGVAGFWNDMNEPGVFMNEKTEKPEVVHHSAKTFPYDTPHNGDGLGGTHRRYHNVYGMQMARSTFEGVKKLAPEKRPFVLTRAGYAGIQRFSAVWTGDNYASWDHLAMTIPMLTNLSISGVAFVGADVGGFNDRPSGELYARWMQAAALTPFFRSHSVGWSGNKEPWEFGDDITAINRSTVELRYKFLPYLYTLFREHERTGEPIIRPMWFDYPADELTYIVSDQYMIGKDLMAAPVVKEGLRLRAVYMPKGSTWVNWWTGERYEGGKQYNVDAPLDRLLIFGRAGAIIPTQNVIQHTGEMHDSPLTLNVVTGVTPGKPESSMLYEDAGDGYGYRSGESLETRFDHSPGLVKISRKGRYGGQTIRWAEAIGIAAEPKQMTADGKLLKLDFDAKMKRVRTEIPANTAELRLVR